MDLCVVLEVSTGNHDEASILLVGIPYFAESRQHMSFGMMVMRIAS